MIRMVMFVSFRSFRFFSTNIIDGVYAQVNIYFEFFLKIAKTVMARVADEKRPACCVASWPL